jgi:hypothetical protein
VPTFLDPPRQAHHPHAAALARADGARPAALSLALLPGPQARVVGVLAQPPHVVMGLRGWEDAFEGVLTDGAPFVLFEVEKIARMALRQDGLAFEILAAPGRLHSTDFEPRDLVSWAMTRGALAHYRDVTAPWLDALSRLPADAVRAGARELLTGAALARHGAFGLELGRLLERLGEDELAGLLAELDARPDDAALRAGLTARAAELHAELDPAADGPLPARPPDYDALHHAVHAWRMRAGGHAAAT